MPDEQAFAFSFIYGVWGAVCGLAPLVIGYRRGQYVLAVLGFAACVAAGLFLGRSAAILVALVMSAGIAHLRRLRRQRRPTDPWDKPGY